MSAGPQKTIPIVAAEEAGDPGCSGSESFALMVLGDSMAPEFVEGEIIVIEPDGHVDGGSYVIAQVAGEWIFRQLVRGAAGWQLRPLNPAYRPRTWPGVSGRPETVSAARAPQSRENGEVVAARSQAPELECRRAVSTAIRPRSNRWY
ncbi:MAG: S24 family peptidase [Betaproteobacteria bacterium]|nr:S24 family peptidase [Betaproteobacteria bacterium]